MTWEPAYCTAADLAGQLSVSPSERELAQIALAASRAIDRAAGRQFGCTDVMTRKFKAEWFRGLYYVDTIDIAELTKVEVNGVQVDVYPSPENADLAGEPYTGFTFRGPSCTSVAVTGRFGWLAVPEPIKVATRIQAGKFYSRRNEAGLLTKEVVDDIERGWATAATQDLDSDVLAMVAPYRRVWAVA